MIGVTWLDFLVFGILFLSLIIGLSRGLLKEIISIMSIFVALLVTVKFAAPLVNILTSSQGAKDVISAISTFIGVNATVWLSTITLGISVLVLFAGTYFTGEAVNYYMPADWMFPSISSLLLRIMGAGVGLIRGYIINVVFLFLVQISPISQTDAWTQSYFVPRYQANITQFGNMVQQGGLKS